VHTLDTKRGLLRALPPEGVAVKRSAMFGASLPEALLYSANSTVSLLRAPVRELTTTGGAMDILLRLLGPLFFGLILVSLRGRIKR
jgi:hypothetical protein